ncbi:hypothetical protein TNIN_32831 [Trichonephila inaurata madagascariensis]|uniref:Uncharacterized protein n=1 Tax=Trichonephila inaurata madagascariensis TaxID=2747483 RepID=A0A8X6Y1P7_9ARAC|nr:hypothetical protein TNIN_32831 [Trichonephila inaurata madagascariensis]
MAGLLVRRNKKNSTWHFFMESNSKVGVLWNSSIRFTSPQVKKTPTSCSAALAVGSGAKFSSSHRWLLSLPFSGSLSAPDEDSTDLFGFTHSGALRFGLLLYCNKDGGEHFLRFTLSAAFLFDILLHCSKNSSDLFRFTHSSVRLLAFLPSLFLCSGPWSVRELSMEECHRILPFLSNRRLLPASGLLFCLSLYHLRFALCASRPLFTGLLVSTSTSPLSLR